MWVFISSQLRENCIPRFWQLTNFIHTLFYPLHSLVDVPSGSFPVDPVTLCQGSGISWRRVKISLNKKRTWGLLACCPVLKLFVWEGPIPIVEVCCHASWCCAVYFKVARTTHYINFSQQLFWNLQSFQVIIHIVYVEELSILLKIPLTVSLSNFFIIISNQYLSHQHYAWPPSSALPSIT